MAGPSATPWTYSDWNQQVLYPDGSTARLTRLDQHISEVSNAISCGGYTVRGRSLTVQDLAHYLTQLQKIRVVEADRTGLANGQRLGWTRGKARYY
jgi:hypothetical protein